MYKQCPRCTRSTDKPEDLFGRNRRSADGFAVYCKPCCREIHRKWCADHPEVIHRKSLARSNPALRVKSEYVCPPELQQAVEALVGKCL